MLKYTGKRLLASVLTLLIILTVVFVLMRQMPIEGYFDNFDKVDKAVVNAKLRQLGLLDPIWVQLKNFYASLLRGDLGISNRYAVGVPIGSVILSKAPVSIQMGLMSMALSLLAGIPLGAQMARSKSKFWDKLGTGFIVFINAVPAAVYYIYLQSYGSSAMNIPMLFDYSKPVTWILPVVSMSLGSTAYYAMWLRRYMVDEINKDYVKLARAKGVSENNIALHHVFRNAMVPLVQYIPSAFLNTVVGSIYIESLYSIPGMGGLLVTCVQRHDNTMVQGIVLLYACVGIIGLILGDLLMVLIDPRISFGKKEGGR